MNKKRKYYWVLEIKSNVWFKSKEKNAFNLSDAKTYRSIEKATSQLKHLIKFDKTEKYKNAIYSQIGCYERLK